VKVIVSDVAWAPDRECRSRLGVACNSGNERQFNHQCVPPFVPDLSDYTVLGTVPRGSGAFELCATGGRELNLPFTSVLTDSSPNPSFLLQRS
jgi:hypothetical protein